MTYTLVRKLLRDFRWSLIIVALLLGAFQCLWARVTRSVSLDLWSYLATLVPFEELQKKIFEGPGKIVQTLIGGETIDFRHLQDMLSIGYVHPLTQTILCVWAIGRAAGAVAGEIDRGTMELLLAQPITRSSVILAHLTVDVMTIPVLCLSLWSGTCLGIWLVDLDADPLRFAPALLNIAALLFAVSGYTMWLSAAGRFRGRVLGLAVLVTLLQFLVNLIGQLWDQVELLRPFTVFYYYQPQQSILQPQWYRHGDCWLHLAVLAGVGAVGYLLSWWTFCRRDLPAPL